MNLQYCSVILRIFVLLCVLFRRTVEDPANTLQKNSPWRPDSTLTLFTEQRKTADKED